LIDQVLAVNSFAVTATGGPCTVPRSVEQGVSLLGGVALVEQVVGERGMRFAERGGEGLRFECLRANGAVGVERVPNYQNVDAMLSNKAGDGLEIGTECGAVKGEKRLCDQPQGIGDGETDAAVANVKRENAWRFLHTQGSVYGRVASRFIVACIVSSLNAV